MQTEDLTELLREDIRSGILVPGQSLVQEELAKRFSVSRIPIREALMTLAADGIVIARQGGGHAVRKLRAEEVEELYDLRMSIEPGLSPYIVANASRKSIEKWRQMAQTLRGMDTNSRGWVTENYRFHLSIYACAEREHSLRLIRALLDLTMPYSRMFMAELGSEQTPPDEVHVHDEHDEMVTLIEAGNAEALRQIITQHLSTTRRHVSNYLSERREH
ncbi:GntR family transcriptional regulator [Robbsia sp. KACC 23696]|uniref:GntR family transcriptional regulator n=1 Tax=Robbsia sp. KACC 23696 TaxID=3149231 RepID=UPI00325BD3A7